MKTKPFFITDLDYKLLKEKYPDEKEFNLVIDKINDNYPVQYAIGYVDFYNNIINVDERVLVPRFETELLVDKIINYVDKSKKVDILDICTGSGCIAIALKNNLKSDVYAMDISKKALELAKKNAVINNSDISFFEGDILKPVECSKKFDVIISNPPYVKDNEEVSLNTNFEPKIALYPGKDDIIFYKKIIKLSKKILKKNGILAFEIGSTQGNRIKNYAKDHFKTAKITIEKDYNNHDRFIFIINE